MIRQDHPIERYYPATTLTGEIEGKAGALDASGKLILASTSIAPLGVIINTQSVFEKINSASIALYGCAKEVDVAVVTGTYAAGDYLAVNDDGLFTKTTAANAVVGQVLKVVAAVTTTADGQLIIATL